MKRNKKKHVEQTEAKPPVYGNESFGIPSDYTKRQKFSGVKLAFYIVVVVCICGLLYSGFYKAADRFLPEMTFDKSQAPLLYVRNQDITIKEHQERRGKAVASSEQRYTGGNNEQIVMSDNYKYIFFAQENSGEESGFDLCFRKISSIDGKKQDLPEETVRIDSDVRSYKTHPDGNFVLYLKGTQLYFSNLKKSKIVSTDVKEFYISQNNQQVIYYKNDGRVYTCGTSLKSKPELVDTDVTKVLTEKQTYAKMFYMKGTHLYEKEYGAEQKLIAENVADAILLGDTVYFVRREPYEWQFREIFVDDRRVQDKELEEPDLKDYYMADAVGNRYVDEVAYRDAQEAYQLKKMRDTVRQYFALNPISTEQFVLYAVDEGETQLVDKNLAEYTLRHHSCKETIVYKRNVLREEKIKISTVNGINDAIIRGTEYVNVPATVGLNVLEEGKKPYLGMSVFPTGQIEISLDGTYLYCIEGKKNGETGTLVRYEMTGKTLKNRKVLQKNVTDFAVDGAKSDVAIVFAGNTMGVVMGDTYTHLSDNSTHDFFYVDGTLYYFDEYNEGTLSGTLKLFREGKVKTVDTNVHAFDVRNLKTVAYIRQYDTELGFGTLYVKTGNRAREKVDVCVRSILY